MKTLLLLSLVTAPLFAAEGPFLVDSARAHKEAKRRKAPMMIDFFGIWCPPCNELDETVFSTPAFLEKGKAFTLLKVDADAEASWKLKDRYKIGGYPTIVFTDPNGKEIYRIVGSRPAAEVLRVMDTVLAAKGKPFDKACASKETEDVWRCAVVCSERQDLKCAAKAFQKLQGKVPAGSPRDLVARTYAVEHAENGDLKRLGYEKLLAEFPASPMALQWADSYLDLFGETPKLKPNAQLVDKVIANSKGMAADPTAAELGFTAGGIAQLRGSILGNLGRSAEAKAAWKEAAQILNEEAAKLPAGMPARGFTIERVYSLEQAGELEEALKLAEQYRAKFPAEFTFHYQAASMLGRAKRYPDAIAAAKKAFETSYGDNRIRAATQLVELYATVPDKAAAKDVRDKVVAHIKPDAKLEIRTHRYLKRLQEALDKAFGG